MNNINVKDWFDIEAISKKDISSIFVDMRIFLQIKHFEEYSNYYDGNLIIENETISLNITNVRKKLKLFGFKSWQISSKILDNKTRIAILYADIEMNTELIKQEMDSLGWEFSDISEPFFIRNKQFIMMTFDPADLKDITHEIFKYDCIYHWTHESRINSILKYGIEPRNENSFLKYKPKIHLLKEYVKKQDSSFIGWQLYHNNISKLNGNYILLKISVDKLPKHIKFYGDPRCEPGTITKTIIPKDSIKIFAKIFYTDKNEYHGELYTEI